jgi:hypothetical protein
MSYYAVLADYTVFDGGFGLDLTALLDDAVVFDLDSCW